VKVRTYRPRGASRTLLSCRSPEVPLSGPAGTGKSRACLEKLHHMAMLNPGMKALIVRKTLVSLRASALQTYRKDVAATNLANGDVRWYGGSSSEPPSFQYANGSTIAVGGMDNATRVMSTEYDLIYVQEAIELTEDDWEALTTRLRNGVVSFQQIIADTNPSTPTHWLKQRCDRGATLMLDTEHTDNPRYFQDSGEPTDEGASYLATLDALTGVRHARLRKGLWVAAEGIIYEDLNPAVHFVPWFAVPPGWPRYWSIDWGYVNPTVVQCWAEDPDGRLYLYRELYHSGRTVDQIAAQLMGILDPSGHLEEGRWVAGDDGWIEPRPSRVLADHDSGDREQFRKITGISTKPANKVVGLGIQAVARRLRPAQDGRPRLFVMKNALVERDQSLADRKVPTCTQEELPGYIWDTGAGQALKESPRKEHDHGCDAARYLVAERDLSGTNRVRFL
jgi:phage terminase large subunit